MRPKRRTGVAALLAILVAVILGWLLLHERSARAPEPSAREALLQRQTQEVMQLVQAAKGGSLLKFDGILVVVDQGLVQDLVRSVTPLEGDVGGGFYVRLDSATATFENGLALVRLEGKASVSGRVASADVIVYGTIDVVDLAEDSGSLRCHLTVFAVEAVRAEVLGINQPVRRLTEALTQGGLSKLLGSIEVPVRIQDRITIPAVDSKRLKIPAADLPIRVAVTDMKVFAGRLWVCLHATLEAAGVGASQP